ncbi:hypothetical protein GCM10027081_49680 [Cupriavidus yeoncheonensis]
MSAGSPNAARISLIQETDMKQAEQAIVAVVTGGSRGAGKGIALALGAAGARCM